MDHHHNDLIFVSIASYRDLQLVPTILDCIAKASAPELLRFGVCWQHGPEEERHALFDDERFRVLEVDWRESRGACWARAEVMKLWQGEDWYLQVDSHCRFQEDWDIAMLEVMAATGADKPIVSTYATGFEPGMEGEAERLLNDPLLITLQTFTEDGLPELKPVAAPRDKRGKAPVRARFVAAGFLFAQGRFVEEVPYDPELYFMGEESAMTVRAFTHGYDLFHPGETIVWHDYVRADAKRHWGDHEDAGVVQRPWKELDAVSREKVLRLLRGEAVDSFGLGWERTLEEYEAYAGVSFALRKVQQYTVRVGEPPNPPAAPDWASRVYPWIARVRFKRSEMPVGALVDAKFWAVSIFDAEGYEIWRRDFTAEELKALGGVEEELSIVLEFQSETAPLRWGIAPLSWAGRWLRKFGGAFEEGDFAVLAEEEGSGETS